MKATIVQSVIFFLLALLHIPACSLQSSPVVFEPIGVNESEVTCDSIWRPEFPIDIQAYRQKKSALVPVISYVPRVIDKYAVDPANGLANSIVVCDGCAPELLQAKTKGILDAMQVLNAYTELDVLAKYAPITFHLSGDEVCGAYVEGVTTGNVQINDGNGQVCLFDLEKSNRMIPFTVENASEPIDQLLPVHEAVHLLFWGRMNTYAVQEPFCKAISFLLSTMPDMDQVCAWFDKPNKNYPDKLMGDLCQLGMDAEKIAQIMKQTGIEAHSRQQPLSIQDFLQITNSAIGADATQAFQAAGLL